MVNTQSMTQNYFMTWNYTTLNAQHYITNIEEKFSLENIHVSFVKAKCPS